MVVKIRRNFDHQITNKNIFIYNVSKRPYWWVVDNDTLHSLISSFPHKNAHPLDFVTNYSIISEAKVSIDRFSMY